MTTIHRPPIVTLNAVLKTFQNLTLSPEVGSNPSQKPKLHLTQIWLMLLNLSLTLVSETVVEIWLLMTCVMAG